MKLVVGLGNPGSKYQGTRHNVGFDVLSCLSTRFSASSPSRKHEAEIAEITIGEEKVLLAAPQTYMNLSGQSVQKVASFFKLELDEILVICDDMNLDVGKIRLRASGSAGGQNGLKDIQNRLNSQEVSRLRVGIGRPPERFPAKDYVLSRFRSVEKDSVEESIYNAADSVECWVREGIQTAMNRFNGPLK